MLSCILVLVGSETLVASHTQSPVHYTPAAGSLVGADITCLCVCVFSVQVLCASGAAVGVRQGAE